MRGDGLFGLIDQGGGLIRVIAPDAMPARPGSYIKVSDYGYFGLYSGNAPRWTSGYSSPYPL